MNRPAPLFVALSVAGALLATYIATGCSSPDSEPASKVPSEADIGFSRDMAAHHAQAVDMADRIRARTTDPRLRSLATDIALTQQAQIGRMQGWLELWGQPATSTDRPMSWARDTGFDMNDEQDEPTAMATMQGMANAAELAELDSLELPEAERRFLELMIEHHRGGVQMAEAALALELTDVVMNLAETMVTGQTAEIELLQTMLAEQTDRGN